MSESTKTAFYPPVIGSGLIRLRVRERGRGGQLCAYLRGVPLGEPVALSATDTHVDLPIARIPHAKLPADIRIGWDDGQDASDPLTIRSEAQATALAGSGDLLDINVDFTRGQVRGTARNPINGLVAPIIIGRLNGSLMRHVRSEVVSANPEGGSIIAFDMPVDANDFTSEGGVIELLLAPSMRTLWRHGLGPVGDEQQEAIKLLRQAATVEQTLRGAMADIEARIGQRMATQSQLFEDVVTYLLALIHDRAAVTDTAVEGPDREMARALLAKAAAPEAVSPSQVSVVGVASTFMGEGWSDIVLTDHRIEVRRFSSGATVLNPCPLRPVSKVVVTAVEGSEEALSQLHALFDAAPAQIKISAVSAAPCSIVVTPDVKQGQEPGSVSLVTLINPEGRSTVAVQDVRFHYADVL